LGLRWPQRDPPVTALRFLWSLAPGDGSFMHRIARGPSCSNKPSKTSTTSSGRKPAAPPSSTTPSRPRGSSSSNTSTASRKTAPPKPRFPAGATPTCSPLLPLGNLAAPEEERPFDGLRAGGLARPRQGPHGPTSSSSSTRGSSTTPRLQGKASSPQTLEYKIGEIFGELKNKITSGYNLREIIDHIDALRFRSQSEKHELSALYEEKIKRMGNAGATAANTTRPARLIRAMIQVVAPRIGKKIYDGACGSAGFLCEAYDFLKASKKLGTKGPRDAPDAHLPRKGKEVPRLRDRDHEPDPPRHRGAEHRSHQHARRERERPSGEGHATTSSSPNPPFGGKERPEVQQNFTIRTGETAFLFLQHFIKRLRAGGRAGIVIKNTFLSNTDNASVSLRKLLLETCTLHTVLDCPQGTFQGAGVKTVVLFFEKGAPTRRPVLPARSRRSLGKTNPLNDDDLKEFVALQKTSADSPKSWSVDTATLDRESYDLSVKNPNGNEEVKHRSPREILREIATCDAEAAKVLKKIEALV